MLTHEGHELKRVIVSTPGDAYFDRARHADANIPELPDPGRTRQQHDALKATLADPGCEVIDVPELAGDPNSVFTRDVALCTPRGYIKLRMGLEARRGEVAWMANALDAIGEPCVGEIVPPGTVEGGDVILAGDVAFVGLSGRTTRNGAAQLTIMLKEMGYTVRTAQTPKGTLHLGGVMSVIGPERILAVRDLMPKEALVGFDVIEVELRGPSTGNVISLRDNEVVANAAENQDAIWDLIQAGVQVHSLDLSEFRKGAGGPTCLILPVERG
jgi:dimethylargininase